MRRPVLFSLLTALLLVPAAAVVPAVALAAPGATAQPGAQASTGTPARQGLVRSCGDPLPGEVACKSVVDASVTPAAVPAGYGPADLQAAYNLPSATGGAGQTVAIIAAYDHPNAEADLGVYRAQFGLPPCTTANGCFRKIGQFGGPLPPANSAWAQEISLDMDMVSAACPKCNILLVEASDPGIVNIGLSVDTAVFFGATVLSNSYAANSSIFDFVLDLFFYNHPGVPSTAASGDDGYGFGYPAASSFVTAVGGTSLSRANNARGWSETAWAGSGSGCTAFDFKPPWQHDTGCGTRTVADVSAVADPSTGVAVYDSVPHNGISGWQVFGGTSASTPIVAGAYALAGNGRNLTYASSLYDHPDQLFDVTTGSNGSCGGGYLCTAGPGFDGPTGLGTPNGVGAF